MRLPPEVAATCPQVDIVGVLICLERMTSIGYCHLCFRVGQKCGCFSAPCQTPSQALALWMPSTMSSMTMASYTETTASSSGGGVPPLRYPPPGLLPVDQVLRYVSMVSSTETTASTSRGKAPPPRHLPPRLPSIDPTSMDMLPAPTSENLLATAGIGRGSGWGLRQPRTPMAPGPCQMWPTAPQQQMPTPGGQEARQATPYQQQVYPPQCPTGV